MVFYHETKCDNCGKQIRREGILGKYGLFKGGIVTHSFCTQKCMKEWIKNNDF